MKTKELSRISLCAAVTAVLSQLIIPLPFSPVPITFSIAAVMISGGILPPKQAFLSQIVYILLGLFGLPVFSGMRGGFGIVFGPSGGYIIAYPIMALVISLIIKNSTTKKFSVYSLAMLVSIAVCYAIGTPWLAMVTGMSAKSALMAGVVPFIPLDVAKAIACAGLSISVGKAVSASY